MIKQLTEEQKTEAKSELILQGDPVRFMYDGSPVNITTGKVDPKSKNIIHQRVYWNFSKKTARKIAKWMGVKPVWDEKQ